MNHDTELYAIMSDGINLRGVTTTLHADADVDVDADVDADGAALGFF